VDWQDEEAVLAQVPPRFAPRMELWNSTINMPFHLFRHRVSEIASLNLSRVEDAVCAEWGEIPVGARVAPVDDDDWFAPDLASVLEREWGSVEGISWPNTWIGMPVDLGHRLYLIRRTLLPFTAPHLTCDTNNYALVKDADNKLLFALHDMATAWFDRPRWGAVKRIDHRLSVVNRSLGSQTSLRPKLPLLNPRARRVAHPKLREITKSDLLLRLRRHKKLYRRWRWQREPAWSRPYVEMMADLMDELEAR
jgi:hypothetical protein